CKALGLETELAWAISLAHDLGHTPFGHTGENIVSEFNKDNGGFQHEKYSLRVVDSLINYGKGLNLTFGVRDGIINHCGEIFEKCYKSDFTVKDLSLLKARTSYPATWEGVVVRASDKIAYLGRDLEDALQLKVIKKDEIPPIVTKTLGKTNSDMINTLVKDVIKYAKTENEIGFSDKVFEAMLVLKEFNYKNIYRSTVLEEFHQFIERVLKTLWNYLSEIFSKYGYEYDKYKIEKTMLAARFGDYLSKMEHFYKSCNGNNGNVVLDYIAGMTDDYALDCVSELYLPGKFFYNFYN
ncbi:MAG: HD domain-containing protein, partial [Spirochaetaceae bacterium]|nr:HD domain-containing protein [Spirochaetaceae bacterium]